MTSDSGGTGTSPVASLRGRNRPLIFGAVAVGILPIAGCIGTLVTQPDPVRTGDDTGVEACHLLAEDRRANTTPDDARRSREIAALAASGNADLRQAADLLRQQDVAAMFAAITPLAAGCADVGVPLPT